MATDGGMEDPNLCAGKTGERENCGSQRTIGLGSATLDIHYLGVNLTKPESVTYKYRLDGFESAWQDVGQRSEAIYTQLPPGRYTFAVMASTGNGLWTKPVSSASFEVLPRFYQSAWFVASCLSVVFALIRILWQLRLRQLQRHHEAQNQARLEFAHVARLATVSAMTASIQHEVSQPVSGILTNANTGARMLAADPPLTWQVQSEIHGDSVKLLVRDSGVGLDPRGTDKLFEAFYTKKAKGRGSVSRSAARSLKATRDSFGQWPTTDPARRSVSPFPLLSDGKESVDTMVQLIEMRPYCLMKVIFNAKLTQRPARSEENEQVQRLRVQKTIRVRHEHLRRREPGNPDEDTSDSLLGPQGSRNT